MMNNRTNAEDQLHQNQRQSDNGDVGDDDGGGDPLGVRLEVIVDLLEQGNRRGLNTTTEICNGYVKPVTLEKNCSFVDFLLLDKSINDDNSNKDDMIGKATVFVSHAWQYNLADSVDVMRQYEADHPDTYFWFDLVINNQHGTSKRPFEWWKTTFQKSIEKIGAVVLVLSPWNDPVPLTRSWCLFEIMCSLNAGSDKVHFEIRMPSHQSFAFLVGLTNNFQGALTALTNVRTENSQAFKEEDRCNIFRAVEESIGFHALNSLVNDQMRQWFISAGLREVQEVGQADRDFSKDTQFAMLCSGLGTMLLTFGEYDKALHYFQQALVIFLAALGENHTNTVGAYNNIGTVYQKQGNTSKSIEFFEKALVILQRNNHPYAAILLSNIAGELAGVGEDNKALQYYEQAIALMSQTLGDNHPLAATAYSNMAIVFNKKGEHARALECYKNVERAIVTAQGEDSLDLATLHNNMAVAFDSIGDHVSAHMCYNNVVRIRRKLLGQDNPIMSVTYTNMALHFRDRQDHEKALEYFELALAIESKLHPTTGNEVNNPTVAKIHSLMASEYALQGDHDKAELHLSQMKPRAEMHPTAMIGSNNIDVGTARREQQTATIVVGNRDEDNVNKYMGVTAQQAVADDYYSEHESNGNSNNNNNHDDKMVGIRRDHIDGSNEPTNPVEVVVTSKSRKGCGTSSLCAIM